MEITHPVILILGFLVLGRLMLYFIPVGLWLSAKISGVKISLLELTFMKSRKSPIEDIIRGMIESSKAGIPISRMNLEAHALAGGNIQNLVHGLVAAKKAGLELKYNKACSADLNGIDLLEAIKQEVDKTEKG